MIYKGVHVSPDVQDLLVRGKTKEADKIFKDITDRFHKLYGDDAKWFMEVSRDLNYG